LLSLFASINYAAPLLGALVADKYLGRYRTILVFSSVYVVGMFLCTYAAHPSVIGDDPDQASSESITLFFVALFGGVALGSGGIKPNVVVLGAEQFDTSKKSEADQQQSYFNYFYWSINIGASFSFGYLAWLATHGAPPLISEDAGFFASFLIPACFMAIAVGVFFLGRKRYKKSPPSGSALEDFFGVLRESARRTREGRAILTALCMLMVALIMTVTSYFVCHECEDADVHNPSFLLAVASALFVVVATGLIIHYGQRSIYLQQLNAAAGGPFDSKKCNDSADVVRQFPLLGFLIVFWCVYHQMTGNFVLQGCHMDLRLSPHSKTSVQLTPTQLNLLDCSVILAFIPLFDRYLYPAVGRHLGYSPRPLQKIGVGFIFGALSMLVAGWVELQRKSAPLLCTSLELIITDDGTAVCPTGVDGFPAMDFSPGSGRCKACDYEASACGTHTIMSDFSVFYQVPQYVPSPSFLSSFLLSFVPSFLLLFSFLDLFFFLPSLTSVLH
jgi:peptide/histidine transporter 3/4